MLNVVAAGIGGGGTHGLRRFAGHASFELQVQDLLVVAVPDDIDHDFVLALEFAAQQFFGERIFDAAFDRAAQRAGTVVEALAAFLDQEFLGVVGQPQLDSRDRPAGSARSTSSMSMTSFRSSVVKCRKMITSSRRLRNSGRNTRSMCSLTRSFMLS